jgi:hypothetical protein
MATAIRRFGGRSTTCGKSHLLLQRVGSRETKREADSALMRDSRAAGRGIPGPPQSRSRCHVGAIAAPRRGSLAGLGLGAR